MFGMWSIVVPEKEYGETWAGEIYGDSRCVMIALVLLAKYERNNLSTVSVIGPSNVISILLSSP
jgi:hypothetical protein